MTIKNLYKIIRPDGGVTISTAQPDGDYVQLEFYDDGLSRWRRAWVRTDKVTSFYLYSTGY